MQIAFKWLLFAYFFIAAAATIGIGYFAIQVLQLLDII